MAKEFEIRREVELNATPEEVWDAIATPQGNAAWIFPPPVGPGGETPPGFELHSERPHRFGVTMGEGTDFYNALEYQIEGRDGGKAVLRYVHSGIFVDDWEHQYDDASRHTDFYLHTLGQYLEHFAGRTATYVGDVPGGIEGPDASKQPASFERLQRALGLDPATVAEGDEVHLAPRGLEPIDGVVDYRRDHFLGIRTGAGMYRFFGRNAFGKPVGLQLHLFSDGVDADGLKRQWHEWLEAVFA
jgi:hypothetical protein